MISIKLEKIEEMYHQPTHMSVNDVQLRESLKEDRKTKKIVDIYPDW